MQHAWSQLLLLGRWSLIRTRESRNPLQLFSGWPDAAWTRHNRRLVVANPHVPITPQLVHRIQSMIDGPLRALCAQSPSTLEELSSFVRSLERHLFPTGDKVLADMQEGRRGGRQYKAENMLWLMFCAAGLKQYSTLGQHVWYAAKAVLPIAVTDNLSLPALVNAMPGRTTVFRCPPLIDFEASPNR